MEERNAYDILLDYPKVKGLEFTCNNVDKHFNIVPSDPWANKKYVVIKKGALFFLAYDSFSTKFGGSHTQTGIYQVIKLRPEYSINVYPKDWTDILFRPRKLKTDSQYINKRLTVCSTNKKFPLHVFTKKVVDRFLNISERIKPLKLLIKYDEITLIPELKGKTILGIETNRWVYEHEELDVLINEGESLFNLMTARV